jgi:hypothetical protein
MVRFTPDSVSIVGQICRADWLTGRASNFDIAWWTYPPSLIKLLASKKADTISPLVMAAVEHKYTLETGGTVSFSVLVSLVADMRHISKGEWHLLLFHSGSELPIRLSYDKFRHTNCAFFRFFLFFSTEIGNQSIRVLLRAGLFYFWTKARMQ